MVPTQKMILLQPTRLGYTGEPEMTQARASSALSLGSSKGPTLSGMFGLFGFDA